MSDKISISCDWSQWNYLCEWVLRIMNDNCYFSDYGHILTISPPKSQQVPDFQQGLKLGAFDSKSCGQVFFFYWAEHPKCTQRAELCAEKGREALGKSGSVHLAASQRLTNNRLTVLFLRRRPPAARGVTMLCSTRKQRAVLSFGMAK